jgi:predicted unusual protein kinase regulating ubiquinone biosynthesis (AarF/ABC1/UbiB family)/LysM repeat protein
MRVATTINQSRSPRPVSSLPTRPFPLRTRLSPAAPLLGDKRPRPAHQQRISSSRSSSISSSGSATSTLVVADDADDAWSPSPPLPALATPATTTMASPPPSNHHQDNDAAADPLPPTIRNALRGAQFFAGFAVIYGSYKAAQLRAAALRASGASDDDIKRRVWDDQHAWAGDRMHALCVSLRGFYLKAGQFIGARGDFVPEPVCRRLALLQDKVPPMPAAQAARVLRRELQVDDLSRVFEWIDLEEPLGSASVSQVHKARLRRLGPGEAARILKRAGAGGVGGGGGAAAAAAASTHAEVTLAAGQTAWSVANEQGVGLAELAAANPGVKVEHAREGTVLRLPLRVGGGVGAAAAPWAAEYLGLEEEEHGGRRRDASSSSSLLSSGFSPVFALSRTQQQRRQSEHAARAAAADAASDTEDDAATNPPPASLVALARASALGALPPDRVVAVKVQYPSAEAQMAMDLRNIRGAAAFLRQTGEIPFDMVSAVDELRTQIAFEFDFAREARVMDTIALHLDGGWGGRSKGGGAGGGALALLSAPWRLLREAAGLIGVASATSQTAPLSPSAPARVRVPRSIPGLVTRRVLAMEFIEGVPLLQLADRVQHLPQWQRDRAARRVLERVSEAYGRMILGEGLFQADGHPGNIMVTPGGGVALLDYGQSKQLPRREQVAFARIVKALDELRSLF